jgi:rhodanese-related sulfurtransferase
MSRSGRILHEPAPTTAENMPDTLKSLTPGEAWKLMSEDARALLVDIRSSMEFLFVGHPRGAVHVPWIDEPDWVVNPDFVTDVRKLILGGVVEDDSQGSVPIILICRSGKRSKEAGHKLLEAGISMKDLKANSMNSIIAVQPAAGAIIIFPGSNAEKRQGRVARDEGRGKNRLFSVYSVPLW